MNMIILPIIISCIVIIGSRCIYIDLPGHGLKEWGLYFLDFPNWLMAELYYQFNVKEVCQPYPWDIPILVIYRVMAPGSPKEAATY